MEENEIRIHHENAGILKIVYHEEVHEDTISWIGKSILDIALELGDTVFGVMGDITIDFVGGKAMDIGTIYRAIDDAYAKYNRIP